MNRLFCYKIIIIFLFLAVLAATLAAFWFFQESQKVLPDIYYYAPPDRSFVYSSEEITEFGFEEYIKEKVTHERQRLINEQKSFIDLNLKQMELALYEEGEILKTFPVRSKGREGSWWETPPGVYFVGDKVVNHFSLISNVWMPYAVQFYGNFFMHGWPYYTGGKELPPGPSGGCIRMNTSDAGIIFEFAKRGMPVLVFEEKIDPALPALLPEEEITPFLGTKSEGLMVADLKTGEIVLGKEIFSEIYAGPLVSAMMALTGSEIVNLERRIVAREWMFRGVEDKIIIPGRSYRGHDLLPILLKGSKEAALTLSRFFTPEYFVIAMNTKAGAIGMDNTVFEDVVGESQKNITTLYDSAKMMRYILQYRGFLFDIENELRGKGVSLIPQNEQENRETLETLFGFYKMKTPEGSLRNIFIAITNSPELDNDLETILSWLENNLSLKQ